MYNICYNNMVNLLKNELSLNEMKLQKNRFDRKSKLRKLNYGDAGFLIIKEGRIELVQLFILKKLIKKFFTVRKKFDEVESKKLWFNLKPNFIIQRKSKNARMGKGKGLYERKIIKVFRGRFLIQFTGFSLTTLKSILVRFNKKLDIRLSLQLKNYDIYTEWFSSNRYGYFYKKYLKSENFIFKKEPHRT